MPKPLPNEFEEYELSEAERILGSTFNDLQLCVIHNELAQAAREKLNLKYDPLNPHEFIQVDGAVTGKIVALRWLLTMHETSQAEYLRLQVEAANHQKQSE